MQPVARHEEGIALLLVLVFLLVIGWFALSTLRMSNQGLQIVGNRQAEDRATAAAQRAIEQTISSNMFTRDPAAVAATPITSDVDGDGVDDLTATLSPQPRCIRSRAIKTLELDVSSASDRACLQSSGNSGNLIATAGATSTSGDSLCGDTEWNIAATVTDTRTSTSVVVNQGVAMRVEAANAQSYCQ